MQVETLTDKQIDELSAGPLQRFDVWEAGTGFGIRVTSKSKTFVLMSRVDGKQKRIAIGRYPEMPLIEARAKANQIKRDLARGIKPATKDAERSATQAREEYRNFQKLHPSKREIVFYAEDASDWDHFEPLVRELVENEGKEVCYITSDENDPILAMNRSGMQAFYIGYGKARTTFFLGLDAKVAIMTMPDLDRFNLKRSRFPVHYIFVFNSLISTHMGYMRGAFDHYDAIFCTGSHQIEEIRAAERLYGTPAKELVEYGHPPVDQIIEYVSGTQPASADTTAPLSVVIAPTYGPKSLVEVEDGRVCRELIETLLAGGIEVSLRPHWMTTFTKPELISSFSSQFEESASFSIDQEGAPLVSLSKFNVLLSDLSGVALEFSFGLAKPVIYVDLPTRERNPDYGELGIEPAELQLREKTGAILPTDRLDQATTIVRSLASQQAIFAEQCRVTRQQWVFNLGSSAKVGAAYIARQTEPAADDKAATQTAKPILTIEDAKVTYNKDVIGLHRTSLEFLRGEFTVLLGPSGAGKTTLLRVLNGLVPLSSGQVTTDDLGTLTGKKSWRAHQRRTAMIFQQHQLIERHTSLENVLMGRLPYRSELESFLPWSESEKRTSLQCLERVGLLGKARDRVSNLSGGQMQRVGIAKALAQEPNIVLADEPVASLDPATAEQVIGFLKEICEASGITTIVSLHQVDLARKFADRIIGVSAGQVSFDGKPNDLTMEKLRILYGAGVANM